MYLVSGGKTETTMLRLMAYVTAYDQDVFPTIISFFFCVDIFFVLFREIVVAAILGIGGLPQNLAIPISTQETLPAKMCCVHA